MPTSAIIPVGLLTYILQGVYVISKKTVSFLTSHPVLCTASPIHMVKCPCRRTAIEGLPTIRRKSQDAVLGKDERDDKDAKVDKDARDEKTAKDTKDTHADIPEMDNREWRPPPPASPSSAVS